MSTSQRSSQADYRDSNGNSLYYTVDEAISKVGSGPFHWKLLFLTGLIWAADAMEMMLLTFLVPILEDEWNLKAPYDGMISFVVFFGMLFGTMTFSILSDRIGRRKVVLVCNLCCAIFGTISGIVPDILLMLITRFFVGFFIGGAAVSYTLFAEYCPKELRGSLLIIEQGFWSVGALFSVFLAWISLEYLDWRWYLILCSVPLWIVSAFYRWLPESTRYLLAIGKVDESRQMLKRLAIDNRGSLPRGKLKPLYHTKGTDAKNNENAEKPANTASLSPLQRAQTDPTTSTTSANAKRPDTELTAMLKHGSQGSNDPHGFSSGQGRLADVFTPPYRHTSIWLLITFFFCVFGYYGISFISERYFERISGSTSSSSEYWKQAVATSAEIPGLIIAALWLDRVGRRVSMILCFGVFTLCCFGLALDLMDVYIDYVGVSQVWDEVIGLTFVFFGRLTISLSFFILYIYYSEYYPTRIRTTALGFASALGRVAGMATSFTSTDLSLKWGMISYAIAGAVATFSVYMLRQDTTGRDMTAYQADAHGGGHADGTEEDNIDDTMKMQSRRSYELRDRKEKNEMGNVSDTGRRLHGDSISLRRSISAVLSEIGVSLGNSEVASPERRKDAKLLDSDVEA